MRTVAPTHFSRIVWVAAIVATAVGLMAAPRAEVLDTVIVAQSRQFGFFPSLQRMGSGELICDMKMDHDAHDVEGNYWAYVVSKDGGRTWGMKHTAGFLYKGEAAYLRPPLDEGLLMIGGYPLATDGNNYRKIRATSVEISDGGSTMRASRDVIVHLPFPTRRQQFGGPKGDPTLRVKEGAFFFFCGDIIESREGRLLTLMYGKFETDQYYRTIVVESDRKGREWNYVSTIAADEDSKAALVAENETKTDGFCESRMVRLRDGRLFAVMRRGGNNIAYKSWSDDDGRTWTKAVSLGFRGVKPGLLQLANGTLVVSTGRPDPTSLYLSGDNGETWSPPVRLTESGLPSTYNWKVRTNAEREQLSVESAAYAQLHKNNRAAGDRLKTTNYTGMVEISPNTILVVHDHLPYREFWGPIPEDRPNEVNTIFGTFVKVSE